MMVKKVLIPVLSLPILTTVTPASVGAEPIQQVDDQSGQLQVIGEDSASRAVLNAVPEMAPYLHINSNDEYYIDEAEKDVVGGYYLQPVSRWSKEFELPH